MNKDSVYKTLPGLDCWDEQRDAYNYSGSNPVIVHPPCPQWSRMRAFSRYNEREKQLAWFCLEKVNSNGGIFEHPSGSSFFKAAGIKTSLYSVDQHWWGFPARKRTLLYFVGCRPISFPLNFDHYQVRDLTLGMDKRRRSDTILSFAMWLISCLNQAGLE